jgi:hypothetical protein
MESSRACLAFLAAAGFVVLISPRLSLARPGFSTSASQGRSQLDPSWCDQDGDGFCPFPFQDCDDHDPLTYPGAEERADLKDNNCNGFGDEPPLGFTRQDYSGGAFASAVAWKGEYVYLTAGAVLQTYYAPPASTPQLVNEIELRDWARKMVIDGDTLFIAARGDGLYALDLTDPAHPQLAGQVSGIFDAGGYTDIGAVFNGVDARNDRVAVAHANNVTQNQGGVDAIVYDYQPISHTFTVSRVLGTEVRSNTLQETPLSVGLTDDGSGVYIGYGNNAGEIVYVPLDDPGGSVLQKKVGWVMDVKTRGQQAFAAVTMLGVQINMLSRFQPGAGELLETPILSTTVLAAGNAVDIDGDFLCFGIGGPGRLGEDQVNLWVFDNLSADTPTLIGTAGTIDWIFKLACRDSLSGSRWVYVADEWGGLEVWESHDHTLTFDLPHDRVPTGMFSTGMWMDGSKVYSIKEGAGLWVMDESAPHDERVAVEWIDRSDPGCSCQGCCPPQEGVRPYPPAVFVRGGDSSQGRVAVSAIDRNNAVGGPAYLMFFEPHADGHYENVYSEPIQRWGGSLVKAEGEIVFASMSTDTLRVYQHCPSEPDPLRVLGDITPSSEADMELSDVAVYGDYLFVTEVHHPLLLGQHLDPDRAKVYAFRWKQGDLAVCPSQPVLPPPQNLGYFGEDRIPYRLVVDETRNLLIVGAVANNVLLKQGVVWFLSLSGFPDNMADINSLLQIKTPPQSMRVTNPSVYGLLLDGDALYVADLDNGLYKYAFSQDAYVGFYPAQRGSMSNALVPQLVQSPPGIVPLYRPASVARAPSGRLMVQEGISGRVSILSEAIHQIYLPTILKGQ